MAENENLDIRAKASGGTEKDLTESAAVPPVTGANTPIGSQYVVSSGYSHFATALGSLSTINIEDFLTGYVNSQEEPDSHLQILYLRGGTKSGKSSFINSLSQHQLTSRPEPHIPYRAELVEQLVVEEIVEKELRRQELVKQKIDFLGDAIQHTLQISEIALKVVERYAEVNERIEQKLSALDALEKSSRKELAVLAKAVAGA